MEYPFKIIMPHNLKDVCQRDCDFPESGVSEHETVSKSYKF